MRKLKVLVVGATGQLGFEIVKRAILAGHEVRALVRDGADKSGLEAAGASIVRGDLRDARSLAQACEGMDGVVATASMVFPRGRASLQSVEGDGYRELVNACVASGVSRFLYVSIAMPPKAEYIREVPTLRFKAETEALICSSKLSYTIFRCTPFMDDYFALMGSAIPLRGEAQATLGRASGITGFARLIMGRSIDRFGIAVVPGPSRNKHAFVAVRDVARLMVACLSEESTFRRTIEVSGPRAVSWREVCGMYQSLRGGRVLPISLPSWFLRGAAKAIAAILPVEANQIGLLRILASEETKVQRMPPALEGVRPQTDPETYLLVKSSSLEQHGS